MAAGMGGSGLRPCRICFFLNSFKPFEWANEIFERRPWPHIKKWEPLLNKKFKILYIAKRFSDGTPEGAPPQRRRKVRGSPKETQVVHSDIAAERQEVLPLPLDLASSSPGARTQSETATTQPTSNQSLDPDPVYPTQTQTQQTLTSTGPSFHTIPFLFLPFRASL